MASAGDSILQYGGVSLPFVKTDKFIQEVVYSPDGVDSIYTKITIGVNCVLSECILGKDVPTWHRESRPILMQRGLQLFYVVDGQRVYPESDNPLSDGGEEVVSAPYYSWDDEIADFQNHTDAKLGPKPKRFEIKEIQGGTWVAYYEIETYIPYCSDDGESANYLSNRWSTSIDVDDKYFLTRTITGTLIMNGQYEHLSAGYPDGNGLALKNLVEENIIIPSCPQRWKRDSIKIARSSDSLIFVYTITDKQLYAAMPKPATTIEATYTETSGTPGYALMNVLNCEMQIKIVGEPNGRYDPTTEDPDNNKYDLMKLMFQIAFSRIKFPFSVATEGDSFSENEMITYFQLREELFSPTVSCVIRSHKTRPLTTHPIGKNLDWQSDVWAFTNVGDPIIIEDIQNDISRQPTDIGNYGMFLLSANALKYDLESETFSPLTSCDDNDERTINLDAPGYTYQGNTSIYTTEISTSSTEFASSTYDTRTGTNYGTENYNHPFTDYKINVTYVTDDNMLHLPIMYDVDSDAQSAVFAQTGAPTTRKVITWTAGRLGQWPIIPNPENAEEISATPTGDKLLSYTIDFQSADLMPDGITRKYNVGGVYEVGLKKRLQWDVVDGAIPTAVNPQTDDVWGLDDNAFLNSSISTGIVGYGTAAPGGAQP